jgi:hypothetical protein
MLENKEILEYKDILSLIISLLSVVIALMAYFRASNLSEKMNFLTERSLRSSNLSKYSNELNSIKSNLEPKIEALETKSYLIYLDIINKVDRHGSRPSSGRYLRHVTNDIISMWFNRFSEDIPRPWPVAMDIYRGMGELLYLEPIEVKTNFKKNGKKLNNLIREYLVNLNDPQSLYELSIKESKSIFEEIISLKDEIQLSVEKLEQLLRENEIEEVNLREFPKLRGEIDSYTSKLEILENFYLLEHKIHIDHEPFRANQVLIALFCLRLISSYGYWGGLVGVD